MIYTAKFQIGLTMLNSSSIFSNKNMLALFEETAEMHCSSVGCGITDMDKTNLSWALLNWKVQIFSRPKYGDEVTVKTWCRYNDKLHCFRDFEMLNSDGKRIAIATSKWILIDIVKHKIVKIPEDLIQKYKTNNKSVFATDINTNLPRLTEPNNYSKHINYSVRKSDIDINNHMNNLCYLDMATEILPENITCNEFEILYKYEIKLKDNIKAYYSFEKNKHYVVAKSETGVHSIMKFW